MVLMIISGTSPSSSRARSLIILPLLLGLVLGLLVSSSASTAAAAPVPPPLTPVPQSVQWAGPAVDLTGTVEIVKVGGKAGDDVVKAATAIVTEAGGTVVPRRGKARIVVGTNDGNASRYRPASLVIPTQAEGYALTTSSAGLPSVVALGSDAAGAFHATTTLRQITVGGKVTGATIKDWPTMRVRGVVEGFYGIPWSHRARLDTLAYMGTQRMNTYVYAPKDDPYLRARWRERYPGSDLPRMKQLSQAARAAHVNLVVTLSPGEDICYSSPEDYAAATGVLEQLRAIGITSFYIAFDDISGDFTCDSDRARFTATGDKAALAQAQAHFLNRLQREYVRPKSLADLWMAPTQYTGMDRTDYKTTLGKNLDPAISVQWTGRAIVTDSITTAQAAQAAAAYGTSRLVIWDNFPTNDGENQSRLFLGAMPARSTDLATAITGITTNPMIQPYASRLAVAEYASYAWNPTGHNPQVTRSSAMAQIVGAASGPAWETMQAFIDVHEQWEFTGWRASRTWNDVYAFIWSLDGDDDAAVQAKATALRARLQLLKNAPSTLASVTVRGFYTDTKPWIDATSNWASADLAAVDLILALRRADTAAAQKAQRSMESMVSRAATKRVSTLDGNGRPQASAITPTLGDTGMGELVDHARQAWNDR